MGRVKIALRYSAFLISIVMILLTFLVAMPTTVLAAGSISLSVSSGPPGTSVTVTGAGFGTPESNIYLYFDSTVITSTISSTTGNWTYTFTVPASASGYHSIYASGPTTGIVGPVYYTTTPVISLSKTSGAPGTSVAVTGAGFAANETNIKILFGGTSVVSGISANLTGAWTSSFNVPASEAGTYSVTAQGNSTSAVTAVSFTSIAGVSLSKTTGPPGTSVTVTGGGFDSGETGIVVTFDGDEVASDITAGTTGSWSTSFTVPASAAGTHSVGAYGNSTLASSVSNASFKTTAIISLNKTSGPPGTSVTVTGAGFKASETNISVTFDGDKVGSSTSANSTGSWSITFTVPASSSGSHTVGATGSVTTTVSSVSFNTGAGVSLNKSSGSPGSSITVTGSGFTANETGINITFDGGIVTSDITANENGSWSATISIPAATSGSHTISASGSVTSSVSGAGFHIGAAVSLSKTSGSPGITITVNGAGFTANETGISVTFDGNPVASNISANDNGSWNTTISIPAATSGSHTISASGSVTSSVSSAGFNIGAGVSLSKTSGSPGSPITVNGAGFTANETGISVTFDGNPVASNISANTNGSWNSTFSIPAATSGSHTINASGSITSSVSNAGFNIGAGVSLSKTSGSPGSSITVNGAGFTASETGISVTFDGNPVASDILANASGSWSTTFNIPVSISGSHAIGASGSITSSDSVSIASYKVVAGISLVKSSGSPGSPITVTGAGFTANETGISVTFDGNTVASDISANANGSWSTTFNIPAATSGSHTIGASGSVTSAGSVSIAGFNIGASISLNKSSGSPGSSITVNGYGFMANETGISVTFDGNPVASNISANANGSWTTSFDVPAAVFGAHIISASGSLTSGSSSSQSTYNIVSGFSLSLSTGYIGSTVNITGVGFAANSKVRVTYDDAEITLNAANTDAVGNVNQSITIPVSKAGTHSIAVMDSQGNNAKANFIISNTSPPAPTQIAPKNNSALSITGGITPTFSWKSVSDPNGVSYELQIDTTPDFSTPVLDKANIQTDRYTLESTEALPRGQYYWRVKAIDRASNESPWSQGWALKSGIMAPWMLAIDIILVIAAVGAVVYFVIIRLVLRRRETITVSEFEAPLSTTGQWQALESEEAGKERQTPRRIALPEVSKTSKTLSAEDQARLKVIMDFAQSMPLAEPDYNMKWLVDLVESQTQTQISIPVYEQLLKGDIQLHYEPSWMRHPVYKDLTAMLQKQPILQKLSMFVGDVERCGGDAISLVQQIYRESATEIPQDFLARGGWDYLTAVYVDALYWYAGKSLRDPSERDYILEFPGKAEKGMPKRWLSGESSTPFAGHLILAQDEQEALQLRSLHLKLRRTWRNSEKARQVSSAITQLQLQRNELLNAFNQFGRTR